VKSLVLCLAQAVRCFGEREEAELDRYVMSSLKREESAATYGVDSDEESIPEHDGSGGGATAFVLRLAVSFSLTLARTLIHAPTDLVLTKVAELSPSTTVREKAQEALDRKLDFSGLAGELIKASSEALKDAGLSQPSYEMTGEAFSTLLKLATQYSEPTKDVSSSDLYDAAYALAYVYHYANPLKNYMKTKPPPHDDIRRYVRASMAVYGTLAMKFLGVLSRFDTKIWSNTEAIEYLTGIPTKENLVVAKWRANWVGSIYKPGFFVLVDHEHQEVILAVRGSYRLADSLTDLMCHSVPFRFHYKRSEDLANAQRELGDVFDTISSALHGMESKSGWQEVGQDLKRTTSEVYHQLQGWVEKQSRLVGSELKKNSERDAEEDDEEDDDDDPKNRTKYATREQTRAGEHLPDYEPDEIPAGHRLVEGEAHFGFIKAAHALRDELEDILVETMRAHEKYALVIVGHSLGSAVASLLTLLWSHHPILGSAKCYGIAAPSCVSRDIAGSPVAEARITSIVLGDDIVPRLSLGSMSDLRNSIAYVATHKVKGDSKGRTISKFVHDAVKSGTDEARLKKSFSALLKNIRSQQHVHDKLYPAGMVWHIPSLDVGFAGAKRRPTKEFGEIILSPGMLDAHLPQRYAYACCDKLPLSQVDAVKARNEEKRRSKSKSFRKSISKRFSSKK